MSGSAISAIRPSVGSMPAAASSKKARSASSHRALLDRHGFVGSMSRRGNPYVNPKARSFMKTLKVEVVYLAEYDTFEEVAADLPLRRCPFATAAPRRIPTISITRG